MSHSTERSSFGDLLRRYRINVGFSQDELARRANVSLAAIGSLERGTRRAPQVEAFAGNYPEAIALQRETIATMGERSKIVSGQLYVNLAAYLSSEWRVRRV